MAAKKNQTAPVLNFGKMRPDVDGKLTFSGVYQQYSAEIEKAWKAETTRRTYYMHYEKYIFPKVQDRPLEDFSEEDISAMIDQIQEEHIQAGSRFSQERKQHFKHLFRVVTMAAERNGVCDDVLWGTTFSQLETSMAGGNAKGRTLRRSLSAASTKEIYNRICVDFEESGELVGLVLMFLLGLRNQEACALNYEHISRVKAQQDFDVLNIISSTKRGSPEVKLGGKTVNAPRKLPLTEHLSDFLKRRRDWLQDKIDSGEILGVASADKLPIVCRGDLYTQRCASRDLTRAARRLFKEIKMDEELVTELSFEIEQRQENQDYEELDATAYLFRRNFATFLEIMGFSLEEECYLMGHQIEGPGGQKSHMTNGDYLYQLKEKLENRLFTKPPKESSERSFQPAPGQQYQGEEDHRVRFAFSSPQKLSVRVELTPKAVEELSVQVQCAGTEDEECSILHLPVNIQQAGAVGELLTYHQQFSRLSNASKRKAK